MKRMITDECFNDAGELVYRFQYTKYPKRREGVAELSSSVCDELCMQKEALAGATEETNEQIEANNCECG